MSQVVSGCGCRSEISKGFVVSFVSCGRVGHVGGAALGPSGPVPTAEQISTLEDDDAMELRHTVALGLARLRKLTGFSIDLLLEAAREDLECLAEGDDELAPAAEPKMPVACKSCGAEIPGVEAIAVLDFLVCDRCFALVPPVERQRFCSCTNDPAATREGGRIICAACGLEVRS